MVSGATIYYLCVTIVFDNKANRFNGLNICNKILLIDFQLIAGLRRISSSPGVFVDDVRNPSDFDKIEYAVPKSVVGKILGKG